MVVTIQVARPTRLQLWIWVVIHGRRRWEQRVVKQWVVYTVRTVWDVSIAPGRWTLCMGDESTLELPDCYCGAHIRTLTTYLGMLSTAYTIVSYPSPVLCSSSCQIPLVRILAGLELAPLTYLPVYPSSSFEAHLCPYTTCLARPSFSSTVLLRPTNDQHEAPNASLVNRFLDNHGSMSVQHFQSRCWNTARYRHKRRWWRDHKSHMA